jgi:hypothetical protein
MTLKEMVLHGGRKIITDPSHVGVHWCLEDIKPSPRCLPSTLLILTILACSKKNFSEQAMVCASFPKQLRPTSMAASFSSEKHLLRKTLMRLCATFFSLILEKGVFRQLFHTFVKISGFDIKHALSDHISAVIPNNSSFQNRIPFAPCSFWPLLVQKRMLKHIMSRFFQTVPATYYRSSKGVHGMLSRTTLRRAK